MSVMLISSTPIIVKLALEQWLHFSQLCERVESLIVLTSISCIEDASIDCILVTLARAANSIDEDG